MCVINQLPSVFHIFFIAGMCILPYFTEHLSFSNKVDAYVYMLCMRHAPIEIEQDGFNWNLKDEIQFVLYFKREILQSPGLS